MAKYEIRGVMDDGNYVFLGSDKSRENAVERGKKILAQFRKKKIFGNDFSRSIEVPSQVMVAWRKETKCACKTQETSGQIQDIEADDRIF